jgi:hypothetical protein
MLTMNENNMKPAARPLPPARRMKPWYRQRGFALYEPGRRPGVPARVANAHARFEHAAREAMRDWLML